MFTDLTTRQKVASFYVIAFGLSTLIALIVPSPDGAALFGMFSPLVAVLLMMLVVTRDGRHRESWRSLGLHRLGVRHWLTALLLPTATLAVAYAVACAAGIMTLDLAAMAPADFLVGLVITVLLGLGEEIGWRGYLLPLVRTVYPRSGAAVVGLLHGLWHLPVLVLTGYLAGIPGNPAVILPVFLVTLTAAGVIYAWLRDRSGSVWPVVVMHQTFNSVYEAVMRGAVVSAPVALTYTAGETGFITMAIVVGLAAAITVRGMAANRPAAAPIAVTPSYAVPNAR